MARFQQLSAPIAAKSVEDTGFYRYGRLLSRNDVGFGRAQGGVDEGHETPAPALCHLFKPAGFRPFAGQPQPGGSFGHAEVPGDALGFGRSRIRLLAQPVRDPRTHINGVGGNRTHVGSPSAWHRMSSRALSAT